LSNQFQTLSQNSLRKDDIFDLYDTILKVFNLLDNKFEFNGKKNINFEKGEVILQANKNEIFRIFLNLIENSIYAIQEKNDKLGGENFISLSIERNLQQSYLKYIDTDYYFKITVEDSGIGIKEEILTKIFDPYVTTKNIPNQKGQDLGLVIVYSSITNNYQGFITSKSNYNEGTTFEIYFPKGYLT
jgi:signal transduction histidine kinase